MCTELVTMVESWDMILNGILGAEWIIWTWLRATQYVEHPNGVIKNTIEICYFIIYRKTI